jgi:4-carboxymuconolactone decarboxylase
MTLSSPPDINPESGCRLPVPDREALDDAGKVTYDRMANFEAGAIMGLKGPNALTLHSPGITKHALPLNNYLRFDTDFSGVVRELVILVAAREMDSRFEWAAHEPQALKEGVPQSTVDAIKYRNPTDGLPHEHALIIDYGRQVLQKHIVTPETFARLKSAYGSKGVVDLATLLGNYLTLAVLLTTVDAQVPPDDLEELPIDP